MEKDRVDIMEILNDRDVTSKYRTLQDIVYDTLRDDILSGKLPPDTPLNTSELSRQMDISRTPIREAINKLASVGLVTKTNHREAKVAAFMSEEIHEIFYVRAALEGLAAKVAAQKMTPEQRERLVLLAKLSCDCAEQGDNEAFLQANYDFHHHIYRCVRTPLIRALIEQFYTITRQYRALGFELKNRNSQVAHEHTMLAKYISEGDAENAEKYGIIHHTQTVHVIDESYGIKE